MSDPKADSDKDNKGATFDMYHFFSRKDVLFAGLLILALLIYVLYRFLAGATAV